MVFIPLDEKLQKLEAIRELKRNIQINITDEGTAYRKYSDQLRLAQKVGKASVEFILKDISIQESKHAETFKKAITELEKEESRIMSEVESERRKKQEDDRRKREEEHRAPPLSEGYHGPYRLRR